LFRIFSVDYFARASGAYIPGAGFGG
jgi:hypothetical protein